VPLTVIIGAQWGDEGKGKIVDLLAEESDLVARCQGGPNAGHTVVIGKETFVLHLVPTGALRSGKLCVLGSGVVIDPLALFAEVDGLKARGLDVEPRLRVDPRAHIILPYHRALERVEEGRASGGRLGTTLRGIGPAYASKAARTGVRVHDLLNGERLRALIELNLEQLGAQIGAAAAAAEDLGAVAMTDVFLALGERLRPLVADVSELLEDGLRAGRRVLVEGAQGALLDLDHGTYPYVTSSSTIAGGALTGLGMGPRRVDQVIGVAKAYTTRVGRGPFPTELEPTAAADLREAGAEYGATTGRPRRCGWLDVVALRRAARLSGFDALAVTKLDVLDTLETIPVCVAYEPDPRGDWWPQVELESARPIYQKLRGWRTSTTAARSISDLPPAAREYLRFIAAETGVPVTLASVGSGREETVRIDDSLLATASSAVAN
jgi:adenylosuccinate synthase